MATQATAAKVVQELADRLTPRLRTLYLQALARLEKAISLLKLAIAIEKGDVVGVHRVFTDARIDKELREATALLQRLTLEGMRLTQASLQVGGAFHQRSPLAIRAAEQQAGVLVTRVGRETRLAIRQAIVSSLRDGITPYQTAQRIKQVIGLSERQATALSAFRREQATVGKTVAQIDAAVVRYRERLLRQRAMLIARTETMAASHAGQQAAWQQAQRDGLLPLGARRKWIVTPDDRLCPRCQAMRGQEVGINEPFQSDEGPVMNPPLHPQCRCAQGIVAASVAVARGARRQAAA